MHRRVGNADYCSPAWFFAKPTAPTRNSPCRLRTFNRKQCPPSEAPAPPSASDPHAYHGTPAARSASSTFEETQTTELSASSALGLLPDHRNRHTACRPRCVDSLGRDPHAKPHGAPRLAARATTRHS